MKNIHNQNVAELVHYIIVFYTQGLGTWFSLAFILLVLLKQSPLHLI